MNRLTLTLGLSVGVFLAVSPLFAATYYVSSGGDDANTGIDVTHAFKTVGRLNKLQLVPGDQVLFEGGKAFKGTLYLDSRGGGTAAQLVEIGTYGEGRATLIADYNEDGILIHESSGYLIHDLVVTGVDPSTDRKMTIGNGVHLTSYDSSVKTGAIILRNVEVSGFGGQDSNEARFGTGILLDNYEKGGVLEDITLEQVSSHDNQLGGLRSLSMTGYRHKNITVRGSSFYQNQGAADPSGNTGSGINLAYVSGVLVEKSKAWENGALNLGNGGPVGIWAWNADHVVFRGNESYRNHTSSETDGGGFDFDGGVTDSVMEGNLSYENDGTGFLICGTQELGPSSNIVIRGNVSIDDGRKNSYSSAMIFDQVNDSRFDDNLFIMRSATPASLLVSILYWRGANVKFAGNHYIADESKLKVSIVDSPTPEGLEASSEGTYSGLTPMSQPPKRARFLK